MGLSRSRCTSRWTLALCGAWAASLLPSLPAHGVCDVIPAAKVDFRAAVGTANTPYASPGDLVEVRVRPQVCEAGSTGFVDRNGNGVASDDYVVTVLFVPPTGGAPNAVILAEDCTGLDVAGCTTDLAGLGSQAECVEVGGVADPAGLVGVSQGELQFRFPDTDARVDGASDGRTLAGPAKIVVTARSDALRCDLAGARCADEGAGTVACIDELYAVDGTCRAEAQFIDATFGHFVALPPPNDLGAMASAPSSTEVRFTTDVQGNVLVPMDYGSVLLRIDGVPIPQLARAGTSVDAFTGGGQKVAIPGNGFVASYSTGGVVLPPVFRALSDATNPQQAVVFGSVDAPRGVIRVARQGCLGGPDEGLFCAQNAQCSSNQCSAPLYDFGDRYLADVGPVVLQGSLGDYSAVIEDPVPIAALKDGDEALVFSVLEGVNAQDRNGDADATDLVLTVREAAAGQVVAIGESGSDGRAVTRLQQPPFSSPAVATSGDLFAFLESEPAQGGEDPNQNLSVFDPILRVFRRVGASVTQLTSGLDPPTAEIEPVLDGASLAFSGDRLFFRTAEARLGRLETVLVSVDGTGVQGDADSRNPVLSADGRYVAFESDASNLAAGGNQATTNVYVRDLETGQTRLISQGTCADLINPCYGRFPSISADGRHIAFVSRGLYTFAPNSFVYDRDTDADGIFDEPGATGLAQVNVDSNGVPQSSGNNVEPAISANGRFIAYIGGDPDLVPGDTNGVGDIFVYDRDFDGDGVLDEQLEPGGIQTIRVSISSDGAEAQNGLSTPAISGDGRFVAFCGSTSSGLTPWEGNNIGTCYLHDRDADQDGTFDEQGEVGGIETTLLPLDFSGSFPSNFSRFASLSADGSTAAIQSVAGDLVPSDEGGGSQRSVYVRDIESGLNTRVSVSSNGIRANDEADFADFSQSPRFTAPQLSAEGRFVAFRSIGTNLVEGDNNGLRDIFVHDRVSGLTTRVSLGPGGVEANGASDRGTISGDGRSVAFQSVGTNLVAGGTNGASQIFVRRLDPADPLGADISGDGALDDGVLRVLDTTTGPPSSVTDLCPATQVATAAGRAAFLRPESAGASSNPACSGPALSGPELNGDGDLIPDDEVVHLYDGTVVTNLRCAAVAVDLSDTRLAALVSEAGEGINLNGDGDVAPDDAVLHVRTPSASGAGATCSGSGWINSQQAADTVQLVGDTVVIVTPEWAQDTPLNADLDQQDRVLQLVDGATGNPIALVDAQSAQVAPPAVEDFVAGASLVALRTSEVAEGSQILNDDGDTLDTVLQVIDLQTGELIPTGQAITPCRIRSCDPRRPYRVLEDTVRYLQLEVQQGEDGNDDGDTDDLLVKLFNARSGEVRVIGEVRQTPAGEAEDDSVSSDPLGDTEEGGDSESDVFASAGRCVEDVGNTCNAGPSACDPGGLCLDDDGQGVPRCARDRGTCESDADCPAGADCVPDPTVLGVSDTDQDQIPDGLDNCTLVANTDQADLDGDGVGDACDLQTCGNGVAELAEVCDDGNLLFGDGCTASCRSELLLDKTQQRCVAELNKRGSLVAKLQGKVAVSCLRDFANGKTENLGIPATAQACPVNDPKLKVDRQLDKLTLKAAQKCSAPFPGFAYRGETTVGPAARSASLQLLRDLFGSDLDAGLVTKTSDKAAALCQAEVQKRSQKVFDQLWKGAVKQKRLLLKGSPGKGIRQVGSGEELGLELLGYLETSPKVAKQAQKLADKAEQRCGAGAGLGTALDALFPGRCDETTAPGLADCAEQAARCRFCRSLEQLDGLALDCDVFDDGGADGSCS